MTVPFNQLTQESGYATNPGSISGTPYDPAEYVPDLFWPNSIQVYDRMRRGDDQIKAILNAITLPILRAPWRIDPNGADPAVVQLVASDMNLPIAGQEDTGTQTRRRGQFSWAEHLRLALLHLSYGSMGFEIICDTSRGDGLAHLDRLSPRMPVTIGRLETNRSGQLVAIYQYPTTVPSPSGAIGTADIPTLDKSTGMVPIPAERLVWYVNELEGAAWQGTSILRACYGSWLLKQRALKVNAQKDERNGLGIPIVKNAQGQNDLSQGQKLADQLRAGESAGGSLPFGSDLEIKGVTGTLPDVLASINYYNESMSRVMLTQFLNLGTTKTGSRALGDSFIDFFKLALDALVANVIETATSQIIEPLVSWNFGETVATPRLQAAEVDLETDLPPDALVALVSTGIIANDDGLEAYTRSRFNLPKATGPSRPVTPTVPAFVLPGQPVTARRRRDVKAKATGDKADALSEADRARTHVEVAQKAALRPAWLSMVAHVDLEPVLAHILPGHVMAAADPSGGLDWQPIFAPVVQRQLTVLRDTSAGQRVDATVTAGIMAGHAQGDVQARLFLKLTAERTQGLNPLPPYDAAAKVGQWWDDTLGATSRRLASALSDHLATATDLNRDDLLSVAEDALDDDKDAAFYLDDAISWSLSNGALDRYTDVGVQQVEWLTAEDSLVDEICDQNEADGPYPLNGAPEIPAHPMCRCAIAPV